MSQSFPPHHAANVFRCRHPEAAAVVQAAKNPRTILVVAEAVPRLPWPAVEAPADHRRPAAVVAASQKFRASAEHRARLAFLVRPDRMVRMEQSVWVEPAVP